MHPLDDTIEGRRLIAPDAARWRRWGPYLSERQWGTVREDCSADGDAWAFFPFEQARSRAYRWGEDGIAGFADECLRLCLSLALWNGRDPILKERLFGLTNAEGNHGEDVKEIYYHVDGVPSHAYMRMLYKYPQAAFPYDDLLAVNAERGLHDREYKLIDTGVFDGDRYFDVEIEYAKADVDDIVMRVTATNRGSEPATLRVLPQLFARNTWSWKPDRPRPRLHAEGASIVRVQNPDLPPMSLHCEGTPTLLFCENETNPRCLGEPRGDGHYKDGIGEWLIGADAAAVHPGREGTKVAALYRFDLAAGASASLCVRLRPTALLLPTASGVGIVDARRAEADAYYAALQHDLVDEDAQCVQRRALAGLLWSKQFYHFDIRERLDGESPQPRPPDRCRAGRDADWYHLNNGDILAMPDTWEYPWYAAWDLAFHCVTYALIDPTFAKAQLVLLTQSRFMHPSGELPAYEWAFGDTNPPVHAWAALQIYELDRQRCGVGDTSFLECVFHKLLLNFTWWLGRKDPEGRNIFQGGFLGLDNISLFDRNKPLPNGATLDQSAMAWVATCALNLMRIALELAAQQHVREDLATKFFEHFLFIARAVHATSGINVAARWDDTDGFYYDVLRCTGGRSIELPVRSMVGLIPLLAVEVLHEEVGATLADFRERLRRVLEHRPDLAALVSHFNDENEHDCRMLSLMRRDRLKRVLSRLFDEAEFLSPFGLRALSRHHLKHPATFDDGEMHLSVQYAPGESITRDFGGNSNWRGSVWFSVNMLIIQALQRYQTFYGDEFQIEFPTGSGLTLSLGRIADELCARLIRLFVRDGDGRRAYLGDDSKQQFDPHFRDHLLFYEYFDGDTGRGCGAAHQTGWTACVALILQPRARREVAAESVLPGPTPKTPGPGGTPLAAVGKN